MNIIITACNSNSEYNQRNYFNSLLTLISSIHEYSFNVCDGGFYVYDIGLTENEVKTLNKIQNVYVEKFPDYLFDPEYTYSEYMDPRYHGYKCFALFSAGHKLSNPGDNILWLDSGICAVQDIKGIFDIIEKDHIFLVKDVHKNRDWTSEECVKQMNATEEELDANQLSSGVLGYRVKANYQCLIDVALNYSFYRDCIYSPLPNHRHDQSIYSILAKRYNTPYQPLYKYGEYGGFKCNEDQVLYVHRCSYNDHSKIRYK